jgi:hypothetical protein
MARTATGVEVEEARRRAPKVGARAPQTLSGSDARWNDERPVVDPAVRTSLRRRSRPQRKRDRQPSSGRIDCPWRVENSRRALGCAGDMEETVEMSAERRHGRRRHVMREVARWWAIPAYVAFGLVFAHFDTSAPWWAVVFITLSVGTVAFLGAAMTLGMAATAWHSLWRRYGHTYPPDWLSGLVGQPLGYENYLRWTREKRFLRLRDELRELSSEERAEILDELREDDEFGDGV